ncbi:MAG: HAMP domain-containing histidine kinase [Clostridiaceae bacterium]|nr:HAMP domain-containing histidine kinase [Clostridiaceae bacterium]
MTIRNKLLIIFFIMIILPLIITIISIELILNRQLDIMEESYNITIENYSSLSVLLNPIDLICNVTSANYERLYEISQESPDKLEDLDFLNSANNSLQKNNSFLIVYKNGTCFFTGEEDQANQLPLYPVATKYHENQNRLTYIDKESYSSIKETTFYFSDGSLGQFIVFTDFSKLSSRLQTSTKEIFIAFLLILCITSAAFIIWLYRSIVYPIYRLNLAMVQIGSGDLSTPVSSISSDEIGQLSQSVEDMRVRLKNMIDEHIVSEEYSKEIISNISHDLKTPITAIKGYTEGLLDGVANTEEKKLKYLQTIYAKANDITYLVDELAVFSKVNRNSMAYNFVSVNLEEYFRDCIEDIALDTESHHITIAYYNCTDKNTRVLVDIEQLKRVLHNLVDNAVKYMNRKDGQITIRIKDEPKSVIKPPLYRQLNEDGTDRHTCEEGNVACSWGKTEEFVCIQVSDNGPGIAAGDLPYIFDRSFRADASRNSSNCGSGLGLAIVKMIISDHGGKVWAESVEGKGTSFYFTIKKEDQRNGGDNE